jgi:hypothetical protein
MRCDCSAGYLLLDGAAELSESIAEPVHQTGESEVQEALDLLARIRTWATT